MLCAALFATTLSFSTYTNVAGQVIRAAPLALTNNLVTLTRNGKDRNTYSLTIFPLSEQTRIKAVLGISSEKPAAKVPRNRLREEFNEHRRLLKEAGLSEKN